MKTVLPFRATRYNSKKINLSNAICPPYDVLDNALAKKLSRDKYNSIYLSYNVGEKRGADKYKHISKLIRSWKSKDVLKKEETPTFYFLEETFKWKGKKKTRQGIFALIPVLKNKNIVPHEKVFPEAVSDRFELLKSIKSHVSPIFLVYEDQNKKFDRWLNQTKKKIELRSADYKNDSIRYRFGRIDDHEMIKSAQKLLNKKDLLIADGHHRYATAKKYAQHKGKEQFILAFIAPSKNLVFSYHKVLSTILESDRVTTGQILKTCKTGKLLPQKSTYFYPKVMTGFVLYEL